MTGYERIMMLLDGSLKGAREGIKLFNDGQWDGDVEKKFLGELKLIEFYTKALEHFYTDLCVDPSYE